jgi:glutathione S-transferase
MEAPERLLKFSKCHKNDAKILCIHTDTLAKNKGSIMTNQVTFYTHPMSRGRVVRWMLEECAVPYEAMILDYGTSMKAESYLAINPMGKVPAIVHGGQVVTEMAAICAYLADAFPQANLAPDVRSPERGAYYRWLFFNSGPVEVALTAKILGTLAPADKAMFVGYGSLDDVLKNLEIGIADMLRRGGHVCGQQFTAADVLLAGHLNFQMGVGALEKRPVFEDYVAPIVQRPAFQQATAIDDALIAAMKKSSN